MALDFSLELAADLTPASLQRVAETTGSAWDGQRVLHVPGLTARITNSSPMRRDVIAAFGFQPQAAVLCTLDPNVTDALYIDNKYRLIWIVAALLEHLTSEAILLFNGETVLLQRTRTSSF